MLFNTEEKNQKPSEYTILNNRFMLKIPPEWEDKTVYAFEGPEEDGIKHIIIVTIQNNVDIPDLTRYAEMGIDAVAKELKGYHELKRGPLKLNNGLPVYEVVYKWCPVEKREVYQRVVYMLKKNTGYILTATFSKKTWKTKGPEVDKILMSFSVMEQRA
ncbi:MAG: DcrB-related protein [Nitrospirae bacterium]|nr:DcrB-related protein [Nitrospirota bacterium]